MSTRVGLHDDDCPLSDPESYMSPHYFECTCKKPEPIDLGLGVITRSKKYMVRIEDGEVVVHDKENNYDTSDDYCINEAITEIVYELVAWRTGELKR